MKVSTRGIEKPKHGGLNFSINMDYDFAEDDNEKFRSKQYMCFSLEKNGLTLAANKQALTNEEQAVLALLQPLGDELKSLFEKGKFTQDFVPFKLAFGPNKRGYYNLEVVLRYKNSNSNCQTTKGKSSLIGSPFFFAKQYTEQIKFNIHAHAPGNAISALMLKELVGESINAIRAELSNLMTLKAMDDFLNICESRMQNRTEEHTRSIAVGTYNASSAVLAQIEAEQDIVVQPMPRR